MLNTYSLLHPDQIRILGLPIIGSELPILIVPGLQALAPKHCDKGHVTITAGGFDFTDSAGETHPDGYKCLLDIAATGLKIAFRWGEKSTIYWWGAQLWIPTIGNKLTIESPIAGGWGHF